MLTLRELRLTIIQARKLGVSLDTAVYLEVDKKRVGLRDVEISNVFANATKYFAPNNYLTTIELGEPEVTLRGGEG